ncbi:MAG: S9 family peptidase [Acidobacteriota bacterium]
MHARLVLLLLAANWVAGQTSFTLEQIRSYPFPNELTGVGRRLVWALNEGGKRNVYVAEGPGYVARRLTSYADDDGQEITSLSISPDGKWVVFARGGEHGSNWDRSVGVNPASMPVAMRVQVMAAPFAGGEVRVLGEGDLPRIAPGSDRVLFSRPGSFWVAPIDGSRAAKVLIQARGALGEAEWSPDGGRVAFVSNRGTHALIGVFRDEASPLVWLGPSTNRDSSPRWSPEGKRVAFVRQAAAGGEPRPLLTPEAAPWSIFSGDAETGEVRRVWSSGAGRRDSLPSTQGGANLHWAGGGRIVFLSYADGWPHLYSVPEAGGSAVQLTKGSYMNEFVGLSGDGLRVYSSVNTGPDAQDIDRRHILVTPVDAAEGKILTPGRGLEWSPVPLEDGLAFISATAQRPPMVTVWRDGKEQIVGGETLPRDFPTAQLVAPRQVVFRAPDGVVVHGQLFEPKGGPSKKPGIVYVHGGPPRQMLLGWHYGDHYANAYAMNQYLASRGFVVLSVNYRLGIGYGFDFHQAPRAGQRGASEYMDVKAAGEFLKRLEGVDGRRIGIYGGSYGGYLTALGLARDSALFAAGVDIHGVHNRFIGRNRGGGEGGYERAPDAAEAREVSWKSLPIADMAKWKSPVLVIHGDDDRNVEFIQTVDLVRRLEQYKVPYEEIVIADDTHHFLRHGNWTKVGRATAEFFARQLKP